MLRVATDIGGTFTDLVYVTADGQVGTGKSHTILNHEVGIDTGVIKSRPGLYRRIVCAGSEQNGIAWTLRFEGQ